MRRISAPTRGMTLIEALVALALIAILSVGLVTTFRIGGRVYTDVSRADSAARDTASVQQFLRQTLENAYPLRPHAGRLSNEPALNGTHESLSFLAPGPESAGSTGHYRYELVLEPAGGASQNLVVHWRPARSLPNVDVSEAIRSEVLLTGVDSLEWSYLETVDPTTGLPIAPQWRAAWRTTARLPTLLRLKVQFPRGDRRTWPDFLVAPLLTDDAGCQFDPISQSCRDDPS